MQRAGMLRVLRDRLLGQRDDLARAFVRLAVGQSADVGDYTLTYAKLNADPESERIAFAARLDVARDGKPYAADMRSRLKSFCDKLHAKQGIELHAANEIEGFLFEALTQMPIAQAGGAVWGEIAERLARQVEADAHDAVSV